MYVVFSDIGDDGYMYATGGDFFANIGTLSRIKLKNKAMSKDEL